MKISIKNFKSIGNLIDYELKPMTILSGNNSIGKSSFIQLLLILKQTVDLDSSKSPFQSEGTYYFIKNQIDIIKDKNGENSLEIGFSFDKNELNRFSDKISKSIFDSFPDYRCKIKFAYEVINFELAIKEFYLVYETSEKDNFIRFESVVGSNEIRIETNNVYFARGVFDDPDSKFMNLNFSGFFPNSFDIINQQIGDSLNGQQELIVENSRRKEYLRISATKSYIETFFNELYYIGPLRTEPKDSYPNNFNINSVGTKGENLAILLYLKKDIFLDTLIPTVEPESISYQLRKISLLDATNYWICDVFKFAKKLDVREVGESYAIILTNSNDLEVSIKHVGFGISQVLPIIVQGLLINQGGTLVLEQPEIHLHPKAQSLLFDFLASLMLQNKYVIIETHSDHFITRMRRRIAENEFSELNKKIKLTFIEQSNNELLFKTIKLDEYGVTDIFPEDFIERPDIELKALLKAQMKKRISKIERE